MLVVLLLYSRMLGLLSPSCTYFFGRSSPHLLKLLLRRIRPHNLVILHALTEEEEELFNSEEEVKTKRGNCKYGNGNPFLADCH